MTLFNCSKQAFKCIVDIKILILVAKKNNLKPTETEMFFVHILPWTQIHQSPVWCSDTSLKKYLKESEIWTGQNFKISPLGTNHDGASSVTLNLWNQWINDRPLYQSLFRTLYWLENYLPNPHYRFYSGVEILIISGFSSAGLGVKNT